MHKDRVARHQDRRAISDLLRSDLSLYMARKTKNEHFYRRLMRTASLSPEEESYLEVLHYGVATDQVDRIPRAFTSLLGKAPLCAITSAPSGTLRPKLIRRPGPPSR